MPEYIVSDEYVVPPECTVASFLNIQSIFLNKACWNKYIIG